MEWKLNCKKVKINEMKGEKYIRNSNQNNKEKKFQQQKKVINYNCID